MSIVAQKITYIHPDNQVLFKGIDLTINKGQKVALVGNNGSGKSTFLRILAGTLQAQEGEIIYPTPPYYVPQHFGQYDKPDGGSGPTYRRETRSLAGDYRGRRLPL